MKRQILIVDDEPDFSHLLKLSLEAEGYYNVREENDANRAIVAAREFVPDLIVLDVMMPWRHGNEIAAQLHADPRFSDTPVLFLTALASVNEAAAESSALGRHAYLPKGAPVARLMDCIEQLVARRRGLKTDRRRDRQLLEYKLANLKNNRQACVGAHRSSFDLLIKKAERELANLEVGNLLEAR